MRRILVALSLSSSGCTPAPSEGPPGPTVPARPPRAEAVPDELELPIENRDEPIEIAALLDDPRLFAFDPCPDLDAHACYERAFSLLDSILGGYSGIHEALPMALRACELGEARACSFVGMLFRFGILGERDDLLALTFHERSCEHYRFPFACNESGVILLQHDEVPEADRLRAVRWFELACDAGDRDGCFNRALYTRGDEAQRLWYQRACELGDQASCDQLTRPPNNDDGGRAPASSSSELPANPRLEPESDTNEEAPTLAEPDAQ